jgi:hypothetical protein
MPKAVRVGLVATGVIALVVIAFVLTERRFSVE